MVLLPSATPYVGQGPRYYIAIGPLHFFYVYEGVRWIIGLVRRLNERQQRVVGYVIGALLLLPVVLMVAGWGPLARAGGWFRSPVRVVFAVAFAASMLVGLLGGGRLGFRRLFMPAVATVLLVVWTTVQMGVVVPLISARRKAQREQTISYPFPEVLQMAAELRRLAKPGDLCVTALPAIYSGLTGLRATGYPFRRDLETVREGLARGDWVVLNLDIPPDENFALSAIKAKPGRFRLVHAIGSLRLFRVIHPPTDAARPPIED